MKLNKEIWGGDFWKALLEYRKFSLESKGVLPFPYTHTGALRRSFRALRVPLKFAGLLGQYVSSTEKSERWEIGWPTALSGGEIVAARDWSILPEGQGLREEECFPWTCYRPGARKTAVWGQLQSI